MALLLLTSGTVLLLTCLAFIAYEYRNFQQNLLRNTATLARVVATNATAALAFDNADDAEEILGALKAEPQIVAAALYLNDGTLFATYPAGLAADSLPASVPADGYGFAAGYLIGLEPVKQGASWRLGTLYLQADQSVLYTQLKLYSIIALAMTAVAFLVAYLLSRVLQRQLSEPVLSLARTASTVATRHDYSLRARKLGDDEVGSLTDAFNQMLSQIQAQDQHLRDSEARLRAVLNSALSAVVVIDQHGKIIEWNPRAGQMFGWSRDEALGLDLADTLIPASLRQQHRRGLQTYLDTGHGPVSYRSLELTALRRDGSEFPVELSISPLQSGGITTFCGFITDITERRQAQQRVQEQINRLDLLHRITRAIGERQDLTSIFQVVLRNLEDNLPIDFGCICHYHADSQQLSVACVGSRSQALAKQLQMHEQSRIAIDQNGLARCVSGQLVYEADISLLPFPFPERLAAVGLHSLVITPLLAESQVFGVLVAARYLADDFSSRDCEFLRQLSEHVALATHQVQLYDTLQQTYEDLRQSQQSTLQQERLRALGQMASGVAHDINNAISPITLYTETLLEREPGLSERARGYLSTIQRAIDDVAQTVSRMREFYRNREPQLSLARIDLNRIAHQVVELTRAKWRDEPQQRGAMIELQMQLTEPLPSIMGAESEIRDALTNLIFNAVDAMPEGGTLTHPQRHQRTRRRPQRDAGGQRHWRGHG
ncbi:MAG: PAS domain S-box protein [Paludibacter sp.]